MELNIYSSWKHNGTSTAPTAEVYTMDKEKEPLEPMSPSNVAFEASNSDQMTYPRRLQTAT